LGELGKPTSLAACLVEAAGALWPTYPSLNACWDEDGLMRRRRLHVAVGEPGASGLSWALVADAGDLTLRGVARALATTTQVPPADATFAVVCLARGASWQSAHPPLPNSAATLSLSAPTLRPVATELGIAVRPLALLTLSYDARVVEQGEAAHFMRALCGRLVV
jgi:2-oxoglutarate dehydrogenase E2 component (dihydrolipoamide succinyltransferase)